MTGETVQTRDQLVLSIGEGQIDPQTRVAAGEISQAEIAEFNEALYDDEYYDEISEFAFPDVCVDGRGRADGQQKLGANAAGASFSLVMADALTTDAYRERADKAPDHAKKLYTKILVANEDEKIGTHDGDSAVGLDCGCGAEDKLDNDDHKLPSILGYIDRRASDIQKTLLQLGVVASDELTAKIKAKARVLRQQKYATNGKDLNAVAVAVAGQEANETLTGDHNEVALIVDTRPGLTLNRQKLAARFGGKLQAFNVNLPNLLHATKAISLTQQEADEKLVAALFYNVATAAVLAGPSLQIIVR